MRGESMTTHYIDFRVVPDPETGAPQLMGALFDNLHRALVQIEASDIGVSFPHYSRNPRMIGNTLRVHGTEAALNRLQQQDWLKGVRDHVRPTAITAIPENTAHCTVNRQQFKTSAERLRRRRMKRKGETYQQAAAVIPNTIERKPHLPFLVLRSQSSGQAFHLFIDQSPPGDTQRTGEFNRYGLSQEATVPCF